MNANDSSDTHSFNYENEKKIEYINNISEIKKWHIYNFKRDWLGEKTDINKGEWRPCVVYGINSKSIKLLPLSSKPSKDEFTIKFDSTIRKKISFICIDFLKIIDPSKIAEENICTKAINNQTLENNAKISSKKIKLEIKEKVTKYTTNMN